MSERILKALMQLFAIIARPESNPEDRRLVVESFLKQQLNLELVEEYLLVYDEYYEIHQKRPSSSQKSKKKTSSSSVKVLRICTAINEELKQKQKAVVLLNLLEFIKTENEFDISEQELMFVETVAETFHITLKEFGELKDFVFSTFADVPECDNILIIDDKRGYYLPQIRHIYWESIIGQLRILHISFSNMLIVRYFGDNEMYLNGQLLKKHKIHILSSGASIRNSLIKPIYYSDIVSTFNTDNTKTKIDFDVKDIKYYFKNGKVGLQKISFSEDSGKLIGIMGASGTGKTTLLSVLNGSTKPSEGGVFINGIDIYNDKNKIEGLIGYVSQDDLLMEELTVFQNLYYNAKLCFGDYSEFQIIRTVLRILQNLGLYEIRDNKVGSPLNKNISGGQRKRLNIALELIREPAVLFLDEPTSGLSSRDSENILDLLKELALKGKLVFIVIHQPSSDIFKMFDKLMILDKGGYLIYNGDPVESIIYFKSRIHQADWNESECHVCGNVNPEQIFNIVESQVVDEYGNTTRTRKISPKEWGDYYNQLTASAESTKTEVVGEKILPDISFKIPNKFRQFLVFVKRDVLSKFANTQYLAINIFETPLLAFLLSYIIKFYNVDAANEVGYIFSENSNMPVYMFMSVIVGLFIGLTVSAEEIIKDSKILKRESFLNLSRSSYLLSKVAILLTISAFQALLFVLVGNSILHLKGMYFAYWLALFTTWSFANMLGLNISDGFKTSVTIYILIPFLIIPQIILSGVIVKFDKLNPSITSPNSIPFYGEMITSRWAYEALAVNQFVNNEYEQNLYAFEKIMSYAEFKKNFWVRTLDNKAISCEKNILIPTKKRQAIKDLALLKTEISKELQINNSVNLEGLENLVINKVTPVQLAKVRAYLDQLGKYYLRRYNAANKEKDLFITNLQKTKEDKDKFLETKRNYFNESVEDFVRNANDFVRIVEYEGQLYQKNDPIFQDPEGIFLKAHFYAPQKRFFTVLVDTYWVNIIVIWTMIISLYVTLYFRAIYKGFEWAENISGRFLKKKE